MRISSLAISMLALSLPLGAQLVASEISLDHAFERYWQAENPQQASAAARAIVESGAGFEQVLERLRAGRRYSSDVRTGRVDLVNRTSGKVRHHYRVLVPESYDPARRYPVHFYLHGGVNRSAPRKGGGWWRNYGPFESPDRISVFPASWNTSMWWQRRQAENLPAILDHLKNTYNLDENDVHLIGISDGATGAYFFAFRDPTPWASFLPFIGHPGVLANKRLDADGEMFARNLYRRPFFVVNGAKDRLYPAARVLPYLELMARAGAEIDFRPQLEAGHDTSWWPGEAENIKAFIASHRRDPLPDSLAWETERTDRYQRAGWLLIIELGPADGESVFDDLNTLEPTPTIGLEADPSSAHGARILKVHAGGAAAAAGIEKGDLIAEVDGQPTPTLSDLSRVLGERIGWGAVLVIAVDRGDQRLELTLRMPASRPAELVREAFPRDRPSGRIEVARTGNTIRVRTQGVRRYKLLLSPDEVDFEQPIRVVTNGKESWHGRLEPDVATLLEWAIRDNDRTMLFAAEIDIEV